MLSAISPLKTLSNDAMFQDQGSISGEECLYLAFVGAPSGI